MLDKKNVVLLNDAGTSKVVVTSAVCTHLGCIPIPYLGAYNGYVLLNHLNYNYTELLFNL